MSTEQSGRNRRKQQVLQILHDRGPCKTGILVAETGTSRSNVHNVLRRLRRHRRVESEQAKPHRGHGSDEAIHQITDRGEELLRYYAGE